MLQFYRHQNTNISIKDAAELDKMRTAGRLAAEVLEMIGSYVKPNVSTGELDKICHQHIVEKQKAQPASLHYRGFPKSVCTSVNQVVCHGIPSENKILKNGDIINIDVAVIKDGWYGDTSKMFCVGKAAPHAKRLIDVCQQSLYQAIAMVKPGTKLGDIGSFIENYAHENHYSVVKDFCGHGLGTNFHEPPQVLHYGKAGTGLSLMPGLTFTIEPMLNIGTDQVKVSTKDGWTVETIDKKLSAQWEHTIAVTDKGCEVLTKRQEEDSGHWQH